MSDFLLETAFLTHGLASMGNEDILARWPWRGAHLVWVEKGEIRRGAITEYLPVRDRARELIRIDRDMLAGVLDRGGDGVLTASGTMEAARRLGVPVAVTAGMGGVSDIAGETTCPDLPALAELNITLIATSPKDVVDINASIAWLLERGVTVLGRFTDSCSGFMFTGDPIPLSGRWKAGEAPPPHTLLLQEIRREERLADTAILPKAKQAGRNAQARGEEFHPAANAEIDRLSGGRSSRLQLASFIENGLWAESL